MTLIRIKAIGEAGRIRLNVLTRVYGAKCVDFSRGEAIFEFTNEDSEVVRAIEVSVKKGLVTEVARSE